MALNFSLQVGSSPKKGCAALNREIVFRAFSTSHMARGSLDDAPSAVVYGAVQSRDIEVRQNSFTGYLLHTVEPLLLLPSRSIYLG